MQCNTYLVILVIFSRSKNLPQWPDANYCSLHILPFPKIAPNAVITNHYLHCLIALTSGAMRKTNKYEHLAEFTKLYIESFSSCIRMERSNSARLFQATYPPNPWRSRRSEWPKCTGRMPISLCGANPIFAFSF